MLLCRAQFVADRQLPSERLAEADCSPTFTWDVAYSHRAGDQQAANVALAHLRGLPEPLLADRRCVELAIERDDLTSH